MSGIGQGRDFVPLAAPPPRKEDQGPEEQAVRQQPAVVGPVVEHLRMREKITRDGKGNRPLSDPTEVGVNEDDVRQIRKHSEAETDLAAVLDVLWSALADDEADDGVRGRVHRCSCESSTT